MNYQNHIYNCIKNNEISRKNVTKEVKDLYTEFYKKLMKENEEDTNKWKDIPCSRIGRVSTAKISILFKADYRLNAVPINIPIVVFKVIEQF